MSNMMAGVTLSGTAESGYGIRIGGFHAPVSEFAARMKELRQSLSPIDDISVIENNGYVTFIALAQEDVFVPAEKLIATMCHEPHKFFLNLPKFLASTKARNVDRMILTGSLGSISLTLLYRSAERDSG